jgi:phenylacetate-CoA ligase
VLARFIEKNRLERRMDAVFAWGDSLFPHYRALVERVFDCPVNDCYGLGEGLQCAAQCEQHDALHEAMHGVIVEIVDQAGNPLPPGELGRVIVTRLEPGPMPLIRYDTGDVAFFVDGACACGRSLRRISRIQGRATDIVTTPAGDRLIVHFFTQIFEMIPQIAQFQVRQDQPGAITVLFVKGPGFGPGVLEDVRRQILEHCRFPLEVQYREVETIPLERSNKRRFVISTVPF